MKSKILKYSKRILFRITSATSWYEVVIYLYNKYLKTNTRFDEIFFGDNTKEEDYDSRDWGLDGNESHLNELPINDNPLIQLFDQGIEFRTRNACVPVNVMSAHYNNHPGLNLGYEKVHEFINWCEDEGIWRENFGANTPTVVNAYVRKWNEENPNNKIASERLHYTNPRLQELLEKGYQVIGSRNTMREYNEDKVNGRRIDKPRYPGAEVTGGHAQTIMSGMFLLGGSIGTKRQIHVSKNGTQEIFTTTTSDGIQGVNSYPQTHKDFNVYGHSLISEHCLNGIWRVWFYVIYPLEKEMGNTKSDYEKYLERGYIEHPQPDRVMTERLYGTFRERELRAKEKK